MKKFLLCLLLLCGCSNVEGEVIVGVVEEQSENNLLVKFNNEVSFDLASVDSENIDSKIQVGDFVKIIYNGIVRESYPVGITADKIELYISFHETPNYRKINPEIARLMIDMKKVMILDVRTEEEFNASHVEGALHYPLSDLSVLVKNQITNKDQILLVYCQSGNRSEQASKELVALGYTNVFDFGGIRDWPYGVTK